MAHWDHLGKHPDESGDNIYNGAIDNATGVAGILEIAGKFAQAPAKRSMLFLAVTLEESGLLGSKYFVAHPVVPLKDTVAAINIDAMSTFGPSKDIVVTGLGNSELDDVLKTIAYLQAQFERMSAFALPIPPADLSIHLHRLTERSSTAHIAVHPKLRFIA